MLNKDKKAGNGVFNVKVKVLSFLALKLSTFCITQAPGAAKSLSINLEKEYSKSFATTFLP